MGFMPFTGIRLHPQTKAALERLAGQDYTMDDVVNMLLEDFIESDDDDDDDDQMSLFDYDEDEE